MDEDTQLDMESLAFTDLDTAGERLYYHAKRYCAVVERGWLQEASHVCHDDPAFLRIGTVAFGLLDAADRYRDSHERAFPEDES